MRRMGDGLLGLTHLLFEIPISIKFERVLIAAHSYFLRPQRLSPVHIKIPDHLLCFYLKHLELI